MTRDLVRLPTANRTFECDPAFNRDADLQRHLRRVLDEIGTETELCDVFPDRPNLAATLAGFEARSLILCVR